MKKFILVFSLLAALSSCETKPFKGFLVCKEIPQFKEEKK